MIETLAVAIVALTFAGLLFERSRERGLCRPAHLPAAERPSTIPNAWATCLREEEFIRIWKAVEPQAETYLAVQQLIALEIVDAIDAASAPRLATDPGAQAHAAGQVCALIALARSLDMARTEPEAWTSLKPQQRAVRRAVTGGGEAPAIRCSAKLSDRV